MYNKILDTTNLVMGLFTILASFIHMKFDSSRRELHGIISVNTPYKTTHTKISYDFQP